MWSRVILCLLTLISFLVARGDNKVVVEGNVTDGDKPLASVMVRLKTAGASSAYVMTDNKGVYRISFSVTEPEVSLVFSRLGYETEVRTLRNASSCLDVEMSRSARQLREVTVKAPDVRLRGDTVSYLLSAFAGKGDISLKEALRKIPGVEVMESGEIKYNGKAISDFYIEGMDMLGGRYGVATTNIPASYVDAIEILNNHQGVKIDRKVFNDNVALNVRLKPKARLRPVGTYEVKGGYGERVPWEASGASMLFREDFQTILTLKGSDIEEFSGRDNIRHYDTGGERLKGVADEVLGDLSASSPPFSRRRWLEPVDASCSLDLMDRLGKETTLRANAGYSFTRAEYGFSDRRLYFDGVSDISLVSQTSSLSDMHKPAFSVEYKVNSDDLFFSNELSLGATLRRSSVPVEREGRLISQRDKTDRYDLRDLFTTGWRHGKTRWNSEFRVELSSTPRGIIDASGMSDDGGFMSQSATGHRFRISERFSCTLESGRSRISLPVAIRFVSDRIRTHLSYSGTGSEMADGASNRLEGNSTSLSIHPGYSYASRYDRLVANISFPLALEDVDWKNRGSVSGSDAGIHFLAGASCNLNYKLSYRSTVRFTASWSQQLGDVFDFLTAPVMRDYMSISYASGILSKRDLLTVIGHYDFKLPVSLWFANLDISWSSVRNNLLPHQEVSSGLVVSTSTLLPNTSGSFSSNLGISKNIRQINTKLSVRGAGSWSRERREQNGIVVNARGRRFSLTHSVTSSPVGWLEIGYRGGFSRSVSRYLGRSQSFRSQDHDIDVSCFPAAGVRIKFAAEVTRREVTEDDFKTMSLFDTGVSYDVGKMRIGFEVRNLLDCRNYSYTVFSGLDRFSYDYSLRGREFILSLTLTR